MSTRQKMVIIGSILPPIGGISIHIDRFSGFFSDEFEIDYIDESRQKKDGIFNLRSFNLIRYFKKLRWAEIVFIHSVTRIQRYFHLTAGKLSGAKLVFTVHTYPKTPGFLLDISDRIIFNLADRLILVNQNMKSLLRIPPAKIFIQHAFLPPVMGKEKDLPPELLDKIIKAKSEGRLVVCSNGWKLQKFNDEDMYGLDTCIRAVRHLAEKGKQVLFIFNVSTVVGVDEYFNACSDQIKREGLQDSFLLINLNLSFVKLIEQTDISVRATNTDGDSLSIRESLFLGKPIIASDVVERPTGVILFKTRNSQDLADKIEEYNLNRRSDSEDQSGSLDTLKKFYQEVFKLN